MNAERLVRVLEDWAHEMKNLSSSVVPRYPQLLVEVWGEPRGTAGTDAASAAQLVGEQWLPYQNARSMSSKARGAEWELVLMPRLGLSRSEGELADKKPPPPLADLQGAGVNPAGPAPARWRLRVQVSRREVRNTMRMLSEQFQFRLLSAECE